MRVLWLGHNLAFPPKTGPLQRNYNLLKEVAKKCEVHVLAFDQPATRTNDIAPQDCIKALVEFCASADWVPLSGESRYWLAIKGLASSKPYEFHWLRSPLMEEKLQRLLNRVTFDVVHFDTLGLAQYKHLVGNAGTVLNHHDIQSSLIARRATIESNLILKQYWKQEAGNLRKAEHDWSPSFDNNLVVSTEDGDLLLSIASNSTISYVPNGVDTSYFTPRPDPAGRTLLFCGSLDMYPNRDAMHYFFSAVWPKLACQLSDVDIYVVGRNPPHWLSRLSAQDDRIHVTGFVDDVRPYFRKATLFICPIRDGGGTRLKILDSLAMGVPTIGTSFACSGLNLQDQKHVVLADTPDQFVNSIRFMLSNIDFRNCLSKAGVDLVNRFFSWGIVGRMLIETYASASYRKGIHSS